MFNTANFGGSYGGTPGRQRSGNRPGSSQASAARDKSSSGLGSCSSGLDVPRPLVRMPITIGVIGMSLCLATGAFAQSTAPVARMPDGQPDIQGYWTEEPGGPEAVNVENRLPDRRQPSRAPAGPTRSSPRAMPISAIIDAPGGRIPYQPWRSKRHEEIFHRYGGDDITGAPQSVRDVSSELLCVIGAPRLMFFADFQIVQTPDQHRHACGNARAISASFRCGTVTRLPAGREAAQRRFSIGHWDGNTLVIDTTNLNDWSWFDSKGSFHTDAMTLVERLTVVDPKTIDYKVTVTDPKAFTQPWTMNFTLKQRHTPAEHYEIYETACVSGEKALDKLVPGVRPNPKLPNHNVSIETRIELWDSGSGVWDFQQLGPDTLRV